MGRDVAMNLKKEEYEYINCIIVAKVRIQR
jgi:hypothetical protein